MKERMFAGDLGTLIKDLHLLSQVIQTPVTISLLTSVNSKRSVKEAVFCQSLLPKCRLKTLSHKKQTGTWAFQINKNLLSKT